MLFLNKVILFILNVVNATYAVGFYNLLSLYTERNTNDCGDGIIRRPQMSYEFMHLNYKSGAVTPTFKFRTVGTTVYVEHDPVLQLEAIIDDVLFGNHSEGGLIIYFPSNIICKCIDGILHVNFIKIVVTESRTSNPNETHDGVDMIAHFPVGHIMRFVVLITILLPSMFIMSYRGEVFYNRSGVHLPISEYIHRGHCYLKLSSDYMQTALNAFWILVRGNLDDVMRLPPHYVLKSARTIAMMNLPREKLVATWLVVKGNLRTRDVPFEILEAYRPLFKYLSGREISRLNLKDDRILMFIGTHAGLNRHQVGVVASKYIRINPDWREPMYLNMMNNLLCGVPITLMTRVPASTFLQMSNQMFFHVWACDSLQRSFYLGKMRKTQVLGKSNSWSARDVHRLGLLITEVGGPELATINPEAFAGITAQIMLKMSPDNLKFINKRQVRNLNPKTFNILAKKIKQYGEGLRELNSAKQLASIWNYVLIIFKVQVLQWCK